MYCWSNCLVGSGRCVVVDMVCVVGDIVVVVSAGGDNIAIIPVPVVCGSAMSVRTRGSLVYLDVEHKFISLLG